ncbi:MAG: peptidase [Planctomycetota bacterium]|nr:peptidase [Planctomycetota bacterium]
MNSESLRFFFYLIWFCLSPLITVGLPGTEAAAAGIQLKNGVTLKGEVARIGTLVVDPNASNTEDGGSILLIDDDLRRIYVPVNQIREVTPNIGQDEISFEIPHQPVAQKGNPLIALGPVLNRGDQSARWDNFGRRTIEIKTEKGVAGIIQGITRITPRFFRVQTLRNGRRILIDQRYATSTLSAEFISNLLNQAIDSTDLDRRLDIYQFFLEAERYAAAEKELEKIATDFPDRDWQRQIVGIRNLKATRGIREIRQRYDAGQHQLAKQILEQFPDQDVAGATLIEVREILQQYEDVAKQSAIVKTALERELGKIENKQTAETLKPMVNEVVANVNAYTLDRVGSFIQLETDASLPPERKIALALSGWVVGAAEATDNLSIARSLFRVRDLARAFLRSEVLSERREILAQIRSQEAGQMQWVAAILSHMRPPLELPERIAETPGFYQLEAKIGGGQQNVPYLVQLPPEYNPDRRYPVIVTLHGRDTSPGHQIDWWAGGVDEAGRRTGQAARHGYIVIAPAWAKPRQSKYQFTAREHATVLKSLRDASRRISIDNDRVFLSGHGSGGDAAWDIGLAHPDTWAGVIPIVATADHAQYSYNALYWKNAKYVPFYFIGGELDGNKMAKNAYQFNRYLRHTGYDATVVNFQGRGQEHFLDEILRIFDWMKYHTRDFFRKEFICHTIRSFDNYFWWVEINQMPSHIVADPNQWPPRRVKTMKVSGSIRSTDKGTTVRVSSGRAPTTVWLGPELVDFDKRLRISVTGFPDVRNPKPSLEAMLEDARTRGDRMHPFWARVDVGPKVGSR